MLPRPHVASGYLPSGKKHVLKTSAASQPPLTATQKIAWQLQMQETHRQNSNPLLFH